MKDIAKFLLIIIVFFVVACDKENSGPVDNTLTGKWKLTETLADPGDGSGKWQPVSKGSAAYVHFKGNGKLDGTLFTEYVNYTVVKDSMLITFTKEDRSIQHYMYEIKDGVLSMSPAGPIWCMEGCGSRFVKID